MIRVWWARPSEIDAALRREAPLSADERDRMSRFRQAADRDRFLSAWSLTRAVVGDLLDLPAARLTFTRECAHCGHPSHGKPRVDGDPLHFSLSHAGDRVLLAVSTVGPVGADVEPTDRDLDDIAQNMLHPDEPPALGADLPRIWVRKEAVVKATGHGLAVETNTFRVSGAAEPARLLAWPPDPSLPDRTTLQDVPADVGYAAAAALIRSDDAPAPE
ncbi:MAG: 4'-phosphopantetheinyl transferase family protein [Stackebrandtia sp.]